LSSEKNTLLQWGTTCVVLAGALAAVALVLPTLRSKPAAGPVTELGGGGTPRAESGNVRFASTPMFVDSYIGGSPLAPIVATAPVPTYEELVSEVERALDPLIEHDSLCFPIEAHLFPRARRRSAGRPAQQFRGRYLNRPKFQALGFMSGDFF
jgi:hypothetical protein